MYFAVPKTVIILNWHFVASNNNASSKHLFLMNVLKKGTHKFGMDFHV